MNKYSLYTVTLVTIFLLNLFLCQGQAVAAKRAQVDNIRYWSEKNYTRVVIDLNKESEYKFHLLKKDPDLKKPRRLYIDVSNAIMGSTLKTNIPINDGLLQSVRTGQYKNEVVRVVLDIKKIEDYKVFHLKEPFRIVIDISGRPVAGEISNNKEKKSPQKNKIKDKKTKISKTTKSTSKQYKVKTVILDAGHGGKDPGAVGKRKLKEKNVTLKITKLLRTELASRFKGRIILTRDRDVYIPLDERTAIANMKQADLFVSIHINASPNRKASGVETYFLDYASDKNSKRVAARENDTSIDAVDDSTLQFILNDLNNTANRHESSELATSVQGSLTTKLKKKYRNTKNHGVKGAPFYVLVGTRMPSILVETAFISNPADEKLLRSTKYLKTIASGIADGIMKHIEILEK